MNWGGGVGTTGCFIKGSNNCGFLSLAPFATPSPSISKSPWKGLSQNYDALQSRKMLWALSTRGVWSDVQEKATLALPCATTRCHKSHIEWLLHYQYTNTILEVQSKGTTLYCQHSKQSAERRTLAEQSVLWVQFKGKPGRRWNVPTPISCNTHYPPSVRNHLKTF